MEVSRVYFWQRDVGGCPVFSPAFDSAEAATAWAEQRDDELAWHRLLSAGDGPLIWWEDAARHPHPLDAREAVVVAERAPLLDEVRQGVAMWAAGVGRREVRDGEDLLIAAARLLRMTRGARRD